MGFKEGTQAHIYHKYRNLNPYMNHATLLGLKPTDTGYTLVKRKLDIEEDKTGTLTVTFENDTWTQKRWMPVNSNDTKARVKIRYINNDTKWSSENGNKGGAGIERVYELTGIPKQQRYTILATARKADTHYVAQNVTLIERQDGEYVVRQEIARTFASTSDTAAHIEIIQSDFGGSKAKSLRRIWPRRTYEAKETLIGSKGKAVSNYLYGTTDTYIHDSVTIKDNRDGSYDVIQDAGLMIGGGGVYNSMFFNDTFQVTRVYTRSADNKVKKRRYSRHIRSLSSESAAWNWIKGLHKAGVAANNYKIVEGSERVIRKGEFMYVADVLLTKTDTYHNTAWAPN